MSRLIQFSLAVVLSTALSACQVIDLVRPTPTPLPGWFGDVKVLLVEESAFPTGWQAHLNLEEDVHPRANHVHRDFSNPPSAGFVSQDIWRAYTIADAKEKYAELRQSQFQPRLAPEEMVAPWEPPTEIGFQSSVADEFYLACGWEEWAYCQYLARYRNYVTYLHLGRHAEQGSLRSVGLTFSEIEEVLNGVETQFQDLADMK